MKRKRPAPTPTPPPVPPAPPAGTILFADNFDGDPSVGIGIGPENVWATTLDGKPFELTDDEVEQFGIEASKCYWEDYDYG